ncbi:S8 family serine peptidase, partial [Xanthovirga aplysinae]|uniref:S8 family serine peptidase n=1 Tax=Xanthovirga aplysinae TaxID=2529853 RepID=UPI0012BC608D
ALFLLFLLLSIPTLWAQQRKSIKHGVLRVKFTPEMEERMAKRKVQRSTKGFVISGRARIDSLNARYKNRKMKRVFPYSEKFEKKHKKYGLHLWYELEIDSTVNSLEVASQYMESEEVQWAEPEYLKTRSVLPFKIDFSSGKEVGEIDATNENPPFNDPRLFEQWNYYNTAQIPRSIEGADINLFKAWEMQTGSPEVIVQIMDGGIDITHPDLIDNLWVNEDGFSGYNFYENSPNITPDDHGTHVAGTIAAVNHNEIGVAGVAGGSGRNGDGVRLMSTQIFEGNNTANLTGFQSAYVYAADNGAVISQNSWNYLNPGEYEQVVLDAIDYFINEAGDYPGSPMKGGIVICSAGNDDSNLPSYPAYYDRVIAVGGIAPDYTKGWYSNYGDWVDLMAPGGETSGGDQARGILSTISRGEYAWMQGTSMAAPHVSGIAALLVSEFGGPDFTAEDLKAILLSSAHNIDSFNPEFRGQLGHGLIDAWAALNNYSPPQFVTTPSADQMIGKEGLPLELFFKAEVEGIEDNRIRYSLEETNDYYSLNVDNDNLLTLKFTPPVGHLGTYNFTLKATATNGLSTKYRFEIEILQNLPGFEVSELARIFPNPNNGKFTLEWHEEIQGDIAIKVRNHMGNVIEDLSTTPISNRKAINLDLYQLPAGIYLLEITTEDKQFAIKRMVKI